MSLTAESSRLHRLYEEADSLISDAVDEAYTAVREVFIRCGFDVSNTDPAEELVAAIYKYLIDSDEPTRKPFVFPRLNPYVPKEIEDALLGRDYEIARQKANTQ